MEDFPEVIEGNVTTPAADHLFDVDPECEALSELLARQFHTSTAKLLFLCKWTRPDIQTAVAFLTTRVKHLDNNDLKKLRRVILYLNGTCELVLTLSADSLTM
eukprot:8867915-Ditylum_brightwellii.AAC.1